MVEIDKKLVRKRFQKSIATYNCKAEVQKDVALKLMATLIKTNGSKYDKILEIGCGTGFLTREILEQCTIGHYSINDLNENAFSYIDEIFNNSNYRTFNFLKGDAEELNFPTELDLVISSSTIQWFEN
ncbi:MAG: methyltransferase domain-containing protein, partial [Bacteroidales bacterium]|nr:methyltransferase domain-containing protein [Bacteroidales bacterium]